MAIATSYGTLGGESGMIATERAYRHDGTRTGILYCHGADEIPPTGMFWNAGPRILAAEGYPVVSMALGGLRTWGNDAALNVLANAITQLSNIGAKTSKLVLFGISMGALTVLNAITRSKILASQVAAIVIQDPIIYLQNFHNANRGGFQSSIDTAYGGSSAFAAAIPTYDPSAHASTFTGIPMKLYVGDSDTVALESETQSFATAVGGSCQVEVITGGTHVTTLTLITPDSVMSFLRPHL